MIYNRIPVVFGNLRKITIPPVSFQYDIVQKLIISGLELPEYYQVDFCNEGDSESITMVGTEDGVDVPDQFLQTGKTVKAYLVLTGTDDGAVETRYEITIPVNKRPTRTDIEPTPVEQSTIDSLIAAMNDAVDDAEASATAAEGYAANAEASAERAEQAAQSIDGKVERAEAAAQAAEAAATRAEDAEDAASLFASNAAESAEAAHLSEVSAEGSASTATTKAAEAEQSAAQAAASVVSIQGDVEDAEQAAQQAIQAANAASQSATAAQGSATAASGSAAEATNKAAEASASATTASGKATEAANSATAAQNAQTGAEAAQAASEAAQQAAEEAAQEAQTILVDKAPVITDTASGAIASFPDGADGLPLKKLVASIDPVQDLHGQDAPYPPGGGKNLFDKDAVETSKYLDTVTGLPVSASAVYCISDYIPVKNGVSVYIPASSSARRWFYNASKEPTTYLNNPNGQAFTPTEDGYIRVSIKTDVVSLDTYQIEYGTYATDYVPYSNLCPISGWTGMNGQRTGKNQADLSSMINVGWTRIIDNPCKDGGYYTFSVESQILVNNVAGCGVFLTNDNTSGSGGVQIIPYQFGDSVMSYTINIPVGYRYLRFGLRAGGATVATFETAKLQIEKGGTKTAYEAPQIETLSVNWQDTAGTVYGGNLVVNEDGSGALTAEYAKYAVTSFGGVFGAVANGYCVYVAQTGTTHDDADASKMKCNIFKYSPLGRNDQPLFSYGGSSGGTTTHTFILPSTITSLAEANAWLADNPIECTLKLATPLTYTFTNLTQLTTLLGTNNIFVDTGDVDVEYRADTKLYLEKLTAPTEDDLIADHAIASGTFFMIGNTLYKALTAIANGATITPGTNATQLSLADALNLLNT